MEHLLLHSVVAHMGNSACQHRGIFSIFTFFRFSDVEACLLLPTVLSSKIRNSLIVSISDYKLNQAGPAKSEEEKMYLFKLKVHF